MATETLEDTKPPLPDTKSPPDSQIPDKEEAAKSDDDVDGATNRRVEEEEAPEKKEIDEEEKDEEEEEEGGEGDEAEEKEKTKAKGKGRSGKGTPKKSKASEKKDPVTPASERPTRERKTVERYSVPSPAKSARSSASKGFVIEKGRGTQLKDIPNVAFKLSKRKPDENLHMLHTLLFGKKTKAHNLKRNIGQFSGYVWTENEDKQRTKVKERIDKFVKEKLLDFCDVLNIQINKTNVKKEELSAKLLEFLESPHATTDILLADKEQKGKKRTRKPSLSKSPGEASTETPAKKQKQTSQSGKKQKQTSDNEEDDTAELSDAKDDSQEDEDVAAPTHESDDEESKSDEEEEKPKGRKRTPKTIVKESLVSKAGDKTSSVKKASVKDAKSTEKNEKTPTSKKGVAEHDSASASVSKSKQPASKKQKTASEKQDTRGKSASKKQSDKSSKALVKDQGKSKSKSNKKAKAEPSKQDMHAVVVDILKQVDFNTATLSDILRQLGTHFGLDLMHRKAEVKDIITEVINNMSDEEDEDENDGDADKDDEGDDDA
ncbi:hypothetical protein Fmac_001067 [Flemingia macrophylla]|uniref:DEK-C domain-containing protein n=1 Tax=Flemingia macrophylla TaxID=520843 RepID=A0ABD1NG16_9FABA